jgi:hypothetical protein
VWSYPSPQHHPIPKLVHVQTFNDDISLLLGTASSWKKFVTSHAGALGKRREAEAGVLVRKLSQLFPLNQAKGANPRYFIMLCGISCELAGCVLLVLLYVSRLSSAKPAKLNFFKTPASGKRKEAGLIEPESDHELNMTIAGHFL